MKKIVHGILRVLEVAIFVVILSLIEDLNPEYGFRYHVCIVLCPRIGPDPQSVVDSGRYVGFIDTLAK